MKRSPPKYFTRCPDLCVLVDRGTNHDVLIGSAIGRMRGKTGKNNKSVKVDRFIRCITSIWRYLRIKLLQRNRRASASLSPVFIHFLSPASFLSQKLRQILTQLHANGKTPLPVGTGRRSGPAKSKHGIAPAEWPTVQRRVLENREPLRRVASDYVVSYETVRRVVLACRKKDVG